MSRFLPVSDAGKDDRVERCARSGTRGAMATPDTPARSGGSPQYFARVEAAMDALRAGESRESLLSEHGRIVVQAAEAELARGDRAIEGFWR